MKASKIGIDDQINTVYVNNIYHRVMHTNIYYLLLNATIIFGYVTDGKEGVEEVLKIYKKMLGGL